MPDIISRETFDSSSEDVKLGILFDLSHDTRNKVHNISEKLTLKARMDKIYVGIGGFFGGLTFLIGEYIVKWLK